MLTQTRLKELLDYDPLTGIFIWLVSTNNTIKVGNQAGSQDNLGYTRIRVDNSCYRGHQLAFLFMEGIVPSYVDHVNGIRQDNRWTNLRAANFKENLRNVGAKSNSKTGIKNVTKVGNRYRVRVTTDTGRIDLGLFEDIELASLVAQEAIEKYHKQFARY